MTKRFSSGGFAVNQARRLWVQASPQWIAVAVAGAAAGLGLLSRSPAAGLMGLAYGLAGCRALQQRQESREVRRRRTESFDLLAATAADLRAGVVAPLVFLPDPELDRLARAAQRLSDRTGAALADLLERWEKAYRDLARAEAAAQAQAAGIRASTAVLVLLPVAALGLGHAMGVDAWGTLSATPLGMMCAAVAVALQLAGLMWADMLAGRPMPRLRRPNRLRRLTRAGSAGAIHAELAAATDLIASALRAGAPVSLAVLGTADVLAGPLSARLYRVGHALRLGVDPHESWHEFADTEAAQALLRAVKRSGDSGAALSGAFARCADDLRAQAGHELQARLHRRAVLLVLPLGACFLPAFLLAGLMPVVLAVLREVL